MKSKTKGKKGQVEEREWRRQKKFEKRSRKSCRPAHGLRPMRNQREVFWGPIEMDTY